MPRPGELFFAHENCNGAARSAGERERERRGLQNSNQWPGWSVFVKSICVRRHTQTVGGARFRYCNPRRGLCRNPKMVLYISMLCLHEILARECLHVHAE